jgi:dUTP pyrophosphatase
MNITLLSDSARIPERKTSGAAGYDIFASQDYWLLAGTRGIVSTGIALEIPQGYYGQLASRSGLALDAGVVVLGGVIDSDYRGEIKVILLNSSEKNMAITCGDRIAQLIIHSYIAPTLLISDTLTDTLRGKGGFGSTGK